MFHGNCTASEGSTPSTVMMLASCDVSSRVLASSASFSRRFSRAWLYCCHFCAFLLCYWSLWRSQNCGEVASKFASQATSWIESQIGRGEVASKFASRATSWIESRIIPYYDTKYMTPCFEVWARRRARMCVLFIRFFLMQSAHWPLVMLNR